MDDVITSKYGKDTSRNALMQLWGAATNYTGARARRVRILRQSPPIRYHQSLEPSRDTIYPQLNSKKSEFCLPMVTSSLQEKKYK